MRLLKQLYSIYSPSNGEKKMRRFIKRWVRENVPNAEVVAENHNLYITKGESETYPCVVAHLDQVQKIHSDDFVAVETKEIIFGYSPKNRQQEGLGADDKNGIWVALKCLLEFDAMKVAFFYGEEVGCLGSSRADLSFFDNVRFVIEPDRRGYNDLITTISYTELCSDEFVKKTDYQLFGYKPTNGLMTDVETLKSDGLNVCCINLSCGYYESHTDVEFTVKADLKNCLNFVMHIIDTITEKMEHECVYSGYYSRGYYGYYGGRYNDWEDWLKKPSKPSTPSTPFQTTKPATTTKLTGVSTTAPTTVVKTELQKATLVELSQLKEIYDSFEWYGLSEDFLWYCREWGLPEKLAQEYWDMMQKKEKEKAEAERTNS